MHKFTVMWKLSGQRRLRKESNIRWPEEFHVTFILLLMKCMSVFKPKIVHRKGMSKYERNAAGRLLREQHACNVPTWCLVG